MWVLPSLYIALIHLMVVNNCDKSFKNSNSLNTIVNGRSDGQTDIYVSYNPGLAAEDN